MNILQRLIYVSKSLIFMYSFQSCLLSIESNILLPKTADLRQRKGLLFQPVDIPSLAIDQAIG